MTPPTVARRYVDAVNSGTVGALEEFFADDIVFRTAAVSIDGIEELVSYYLEIVFMGQSALQLIEEFPSPDGQVARIDVRSPLAPGLPPLEIMVKFTLDDEGKVVRFDSFHRLDPAFDATQLDELGLGNVANLSDLTGL